MIKAKKKICKGTGRALGYGCGKEQLKRTYGLCDTCYYDWLINSENGKIQREKALYRGRNRLTKETKNKLSEEKRELTAPKPILQKKINEIVRLIDYNIPCLARNTSDNRMNAGHIYSVGSSESLRFNLHNIHRQSAVSNGSQLDDGKMRLNAAIEYGQEYGEFIDNLRTMPPIKLNKSEMNDKIKSCNDIINYLKKYLRMRTRVERIELRNQFNKEIGIYPEEYSVFKIKEKAKY